MGEMAPFALHPWEAYYVIVGTSAGALIGLQFVVLTLVTEGGMLRGTDETFAAFSSPNVVHFCGALLVSAVFSAPWHDPAPPAVIIALTGVIGFIYSVVVLRRATRQRDYKPVLEDWVWHAWLPMLAYASLSYAGYRLSRVTDDSLFIVGGAALLLVFIGIHNAWDTVTYVTLERSRRMREKAAAEKAAAAKTVAPAAPKS